MKATRVLLVLTLLGAGAPARGAGPGQASLLFLRTAESVRQAAMGNAGVASSEEPGHSHLNPASLGMIRTQEVYTSYQSLLDDLASGSLYYGARAGGWGLGLQTIYFNYGTMDRADAIGALAGTARAADAAVGVSVAPCREGIIPGVTIKAARQTLDGTSSTTPLLDAGLLVPLGASNPASLLGRTSLGLSGRNLGSGAKFSGGSENAPLSVTVGFAHRGGAAENILISVDAEQFAGRAEKVLLHAGAEVWIGRLMALRAGYRTDQDAGTGVSAGVGFNIGQARLDYAFRPYGALGEAHRAGLSFRFGFGLLERYYSEGLEQMRRENYAEAILLFDKALAINPQDRRVLRKARAALEALKAQERPDADLP